MTTPESKEADSRLTFLNFFQAAKTQFDAVIASSRGGDVTRTRKIQELQKDVQFCISALSASDQRANRDQHVKKIQDTAIAVKAMKTALAGLPSFVGTFTTIAATKPEQLKASAAKIATLSCLIDATTIHFKELEIKRGLQYELNELKKIETLNVECTILKTKQPEEIEIRLTSKREIMPAVVMRAVIGTYDKTGISEYFVEANGVPADAVEYFKHKLASITPGSSVMLIAKTWYRVMGHVLERRQQKQQQQLLGQQAAQQPLARQQQQQQQQKTPQQQQQVQPQQQQQQMPQQFQQSLPQQQQQQFQQQLPSQFQQQFQQQLPPQQQYQQQQLPQQQPQQQQFQQQQFQQQQQQQQQFQSQQLPQQQFQSQHHFQPQQQLSQHQLQQQLQQFQQQYGQFGNAAVEQFLQQVPNNLSAFPTYETPD